MVPTLGGNAALGMMTRKELMHAISRNKKSKWKALRGDLNNNSGYKLLMKKQGTNCSLPELDCQTMINIVNAPISLSK